MHFYDTERNGKRIGVKGKRMKKILGILGLVTVTIIWGGGFVASDIALQSFTPFQILFIRFLIGAFCM